LIHAINEHTDYVTTSSCSGRIALFAEPNQDKKSTTKGIGRWLFVKHGEASADEIATGLKQAETSDCVYLRHEPFVMHVQCRSLDSAQTLLQACLGCGFRESGMIVGRKKIMVGIRTTSTILTVPIFTKGQSLLRDRDAFRTVVKMCVDRFRRNVRSTQRLCMGLENIFGIVKMRDAARHVENSDSRGGDEEYLRIEMQELSLSTTDQQVLNRWGHSVCAINSNSSALVFGGNCDDGRRHNDVVEVMMTTPSTLGVSNITISSKQEPINRAFQTFTSVRFNEYGVIPILFGGRQSPQKSLNDMWALIPNSKNASWSWQEISQDEKKVWPQARYRHACKDLGQGRLLILGGRDTSQVFEDAWIVKLELVSSHSKVSVVSCTCVLKHNELKRFSHTVVSEESRIWISGGYNDLNGQHFCKNIVGIEIKDDSIVVADVKPSSVARASHVAAMIVGKKDMKKMILELGGCTESHDETFGSTINLDEMSKNRRSHHVLVSDSVSKNSVLVRSCSVFLKCSEDETLILLCIGGGGLLFNSSVWSRCYALRMSSALSSSSWKLKSNNDDVVLLQKSSSGHVLTSKTTTTSSSQACIVVPQRGAKQLRIALENADIYDSSRRVCANLVPTEDDLSLLAVPVLDASLAREFLQNIEVLEEETTKVEEKEENNTTTSNDKKKKKKKKRELWSLAEAVRHAQVREDLVLIKSSTKKSKQNKKKETLRSELQRLFCSNNVERSRISLLLSKLPKRWERVGNDVVVIPEKSLCEPEWRYGWKCIAKNLSAKMLVRRATIDTGRMRQSRVAVLHNDLKSNWVEVKQHSIRYMFDITRVMFSAGNTTERKRMGMLESKDDVVVDMYVGIGYFTLPLLIHGNVKHVHACEINPDSIEALRRNLKLNRVDSSRYTIHHGDNVETAKGLEGIADRVLLGLIPTAKLAYKSAVSLLRRDRGGWLHVHENVHEDKRVSFSKSLERTLESYAMSLGLENWKARVVHIERVKSYAPHIDHLVLDVHMGAVVGQ